MSPPNLHFSSSALPWWNACVSSCILHLHRLAFGEKDCQENMHCEPFLSHPFSLGFFLPASTVVTVTLFPLFALPLPHLSLVYKKAAKAFWISFFFSVPVLHCIVDFLHILIQCIVPFFDQNGFAVRHLCHFFVRSVLIFVINLFGP